MREFDGKPISIEEAQRLASQGDVDRAQLVIAMMSRRECTPKQAGEIIVQGLRVAGPLLRREVQACDKTARELARIGDLADSISWEYRADELREKAYWYGRKVFYYEEARKAIKR